MCSISSKLTVRMSKYHHYLKYKYKSMSLSSPEELLECRSSEYVNLFLTKFDNKTKKKKENLVSGYLNNILKNRQQLPHDTGVITIGDRPLVLTLTDVLNVKEEENKIVLIEGGPGMGKSTLAIEICKCWTDGELLQEYDAVILLPLRDPEIQAANNIGDLLLVENKGEREALYDEITASQGDKICFIFEGYDELPEQLRKVPVFAKVKEKLPKCTLMYTSRPEACTQLRHIASQRIEIHGFKEEQVDEYINNAFENVKDGKEKALKLISKVKNNPSIKSILYVPIHIAIVCHIFLLTLTLPTTLTELYCLLCLNLILRHTNKHGLGEVDYLSSLHNLPAQISEQFHKLCYVAYRGREEDKMIFSSRELECYGIDPNKLSGLGLLLIAPSTSVYGREKSYNFLHLTVQEYCSAFYLSTLTDKEQFKCFKKYQFNRRFQMIWRFYSGVTGLRNKDTLHCMLPSKWVKSSFGKRRIIELLHCVYETHSDEVCHVVGYYLDGNIDLSGCKLDQISCCVLCYFLERCRGMLVNLSYCHIGDVGCEILLNSLLSHHDNPYSQEFKLDLYDSHITDKSSSLIASLLSSDYSITKLDVGFNKLSSSTDIIFKSLHYNTILTELLLRSASLISSDMQLLGQMLTSNSTLRIMDISDNDIGPYGCQYLADCRNISLNKLIMSGCELGISGVDSIGMLLCHSTITAIDLGWNSIGDAGVEKLVEHLKSNKTVKHLDLWNNDITSYGANHLIKLFYFNHTTLSSIELSRNPLKDEGVNLILQSIAVEMEYVGLYDTGITSSCSVPTALHKIKSIYFTLPDNCDGCICESLAETTVLEELELRDVNDASYHAVIRGINRNNSIKVLKFYEGHMDYQTISDLVQVMNFNKTITELTMSNVDISPCDCLLLADVLTMNTSVKIMNIWPLDEKRLDQSLVLQFLKQVECNCTLELLTLQITREAKDDEHFIIDVETSIEHKNKIRQSYGVTTLLHVRLS